MNINNYNCSFYPNESEARTLIDNVVQYYLTENKNFNLTNEKSFDNIIYGIPLFKVQYVQFNEFTFAFNRTLLAGFNIALHLPNYSIEKRFSFSFLKKQHNQILPQSSIKNLLF